MCLGTKSLLDGEVGEETMRSIGDWMSILEGRERGIAQRIGVDKDKVVTLYLSRRHLGAIGVSGGLRTRSYLRSRSQQAF